MPIKKLTAHATILSLALVWGCNNPTTTSMEEPYIPDDNSYASLSRVSANISIQAEATSCVSSSGTTIDKKHSGFTGSGFVNGPNRVGAWTQCTFAVSSAGNYQIIIRYANGSSARGATLTVNGVNVATGAFNSTGSWKNWTNSFFSGIALREGTNTIRLTALTSGGLANIDRYDFNIDSKDKSKPPKKTKKTRGQEFNASTLSPPAPNTIIVIVDGWSRGLDHNMKVLTRYAYEEATNQKFDMQRVIRIDGRDFDSRCADGYAHHSDLTRLAGHIRNLSEKHCPIRSDCNLLIVSRSFGAVVTHNTLVSYAHELLEYKRVGVMLIDPYGTAPYVLVKETIDKKYDKPGCFGAEYGGNKHHFHWESSKWDKKFNDGDFLLGHVFQTSDFPGGARWKDDHCKTKMFDGECHHLPSSTKHKATTLHPTTKGVLTELITMLVTNNLNSLPPVKNISGSKGSFKYWSMDVPLYGANLYFITEGGSGDVDMYVRFGSKPNLSDYDCRPFYTDNAEICEFLYPSVGTYHVMLHGHSDYSGVSLDASHTYASPCKEYTGHLSGYDDYKWSRSFSTSGRSAHRGMLDGHNEDTDFNLELYKLDKLDNGSWEMVAESASGSSHEEIFYFNYYGVNRWKWRVVSNRGSGDYTLCIDNEQL